MTFTVRQEGQAVLPLINPICGGQILFTWMPDCKPESINTLYKAGSLNVRIQLIPTTVKVDVITGLKTLNNPGVKIFPNPGLRPSDHHGPEEFREVSFFSCTGICAGTGSLNDNHSLTIDVSGFPRGIYMLQVRLSEGIKTVKVCLADDYHLNRK